MTNIERIQSMSVEELAVFLACVGADVLSNIRPSQMSIDVNIAFLNEGAR